MGFFGIDAGYFYLVLPAMILALYAQSRVQSSFQKYARVGNSQGLTGAEVAQKLMNLAGIYDVRIERVPGNLTDHYDPSHKVLRLSDNVYSSTSISAIGVAAHETGHAVQDASDYGFLRLRSAMVPMTSISSKAAIPLIFAGMFLGGFSGYGFGSVLVQIGIVLFALAVVFSIVTLPVEFNASSRAIAMLEDNGILNGEEIQPVRKVLSAAAMTYVASAAVAVANLLRFLLLFNRRNQ